MVMFSPILPIRAERTSSRVLPSSGSASRAATSAGLCSTTRRAALAASARKSSFFATKSVSELTSISAPTPPAMWVATTPSAVIRAEAFDALPPSLTRRISSARAMSPSASVSAFLHSIIGASVLPRSSATIPAVIAAIFLSPELIKLAEPRAPPLHLYLFSRFFNFDELVIAAGRDDIGNHLATTFEDGVSHAAGVELNGAGRVVVTRDDVGDAFRRGVGIDHANDRDAQLFGFGDGDLVIADIDDEDGVRQASHILDAADGLLQLFQFATEGQRFLLRHLFQFTGFDGQLHVLQALDRGLDGLEVGQHAAQPALVNVRRTGAGCLFGDDFAGLTLGADEEDIAAIAGQLLDEIHRLVVLDQGLFEVNDVNLVAGAEDVRGHLGGPETGLVTEVDTGFQHFAHGNGHCKTPLRVEPPA